MKYPIGIQNFREIRTGGYVYVDKTPHIHRVLDSGKYFFLSRPRRFGKSLLLSTMNELYCGAKELFEGLWIYDQWNWEANIRPVIWLKFASQGIKSMGLVPGIHNMLDSEAARLGVVLEATDYSQKFKQLLEYVSQKHGQKVVLLIDEYDKPIIDFLEDIPQAEANRDVLKNFYSILKDSDALLEKTFITGVSAFSKVSIFSDLNNLKDLTLHPLAFTLTGITQNELEENFTEPLASHNKAIVKEWYNGYSWGGDKVYNPFSLLNFMDSGQYRNFWHQTGTPTFLIKEMQRKGFFNVTDTEGTSKDMMNFDIAKLNPTTVLFQTGYLTIKGYDPEFLLYNLGYPNKEVRFSMEELLLDAYSYDPIDGSVPRVANIVRALRRKDLDTVITIINATFSGIPAEHWQKENEHFYHALIHLTFSLLGVYVKSEVHTANGRCDALVETADHIYVFEFKLDKPASTALQQIYDKGYFAPYADSPKEKIAVGVNFSKAKKAVEEWVVNEV
ncbi:MAG: AAA family ATPase [Saprospiraceae bacterium]